MQEPDAKTLDASIDEYISVEEVSHRWGVSPRRVQKMIESGKIKNCFKVGKMYFVPYNADRPPDGRIRTLSDERPLLSVPSIKETELDFLMPLQKSDPSIKIGAVRQIAENARYIANACRDIDARSAYVLGLVCSAGYLTGDKDSYPFEGYKLMTARGCHDAARICLTHAFPYSDVEKYRDTIKCGDEDFELLVTALRRQNDYDRLIQLCFGLQVGHETQMLEITLGKLVLSGEYDEYTLQKWRSLMDIKENFDDRIRRGTDEMYSERQSARDAKYGVYRLLPGIRKNFFSYYRETNA